ncbi:MAG TPA: formate--tetrahydrofolate ligase, partial [Thermoplasmata archaeon]|nr:formate--tetrahydrofolate ligase [Thermoplasmata archaeon]
GIGLAPGDIEPYGRFMAKVPLKVIERIRSSGKRGRLIHVTGMTPTKFGEGKTVTSIGTTQGLGRLGKKVMLCLRQPSLGPIFGVKGGATGGGLSQVYPAVDINTHFTGDIHAIGAANNLIAAVVDNHMSHKNELDLDAITIQWRRALDMNDRSLRDIVVGLGGKSQGGIPRQTGFDITAASEVMAIVALARDLGDLKERISRIFVGYNDSGEPLRVKDFGITGSVAFLLKDAIKPNLVQTMEGQPAFVHCGPFANIAHGNNSVIATTTAMHLADYVVTESGFAADLGGEKFYDIVCRQEGIAPHVSVIVVSIRATKLHGGSRDAEKMDMNAIEKGLANPDHHVGIVKRFGVQPVVAVNRFPADRPEEIEFVVKHYRELGVPVAVSEVFEKGGEGGRALAQTIVEACDRVTEPKIDFIYGERDPLGAKIEAIATKVYGADGVDFLPKAERDIKRVESLAPRIPVCMAKTQMSLTDDASVAGAPKGWRLTVREVRLSAGAGFAVPLCGEIMTMPGLPARPAALDIDVDEHGFVRGLG